MKNLLLFACGLLSAGAALADDAAILKCRAQTDTARRLACYDAMPVGATPVAAAAPAPAASPEQSFGLPPAAQKKMSADESRIRSTVVGRFDGWGPGSSITLANGQVWRVTDGSEAVMRPMQDPKVEVSRGLLGGYFLQVEGYNNSARVSRVK
ncbi:hypothetical protein ACFQ09_01100 [Massilia norwichensis]|uniref:Uncharacterized protein n=1 Tax=Massilia norwichensis TaxID=1442366 RepID=A0ABT2A0J9_9BURK|nr:hypothetical protein [Massilia norwichensis]MCS0587705.1 hypothetical protein [Massilia norwichensis]